MQRKGKGETAMLGNANHPVKWAEGARGCLRGQPTRKLPPRRRKQTIWGVFFVGGGGVCVWFFLVFLLFFGFFLGVVFGGWVWENGGKTLLPRRTRKIWFFEVIIKERILMNRRYDEGEAEPMCAWPRKAKRQFE